jgi:pimeloyl-ACP methyl ester carboxylesterase
MPALTGIDQLILDCGCRGLSYNGSLWRKKVTAGLRSGAEGSMNTQGWRRRWIILALVAVIIIAWIPTTDFILAIRLLSSLSQLASGATGADLAVVQNKARLQSGLQVLEAITYRPVRSLPKRALVLVPGISELGCYHPRLIALSRFLASRGFLVITPDIIKFREFKIAPEAIDEIAFWYLHARNLEGGASVGRVGLSGISFSGTLALMAAARHEIRDDVAFVLAIGPYDDPLRCSRQWFAADPADSTQNYYPTRFYAKWIIMLAALDMLGREEERHLISDVLMHLLLQKEPPNALPSLTPDGQRWYHLATARGDDSDPELAAKIEQHLTPVLYERIMPDRVVGSLRCPVFLVHGAFDDLIPPDESIRLRNRITSSKSYLVISPFITHTHPWDKPLSRIQTLTAVFDLLRFFYRLAETAR